MPAKNPRKRGPKWDGLRAAVLERDGHTCAYCGNDANEVDHLTPYNLGGLDEMSNLVACCRTCNARKGDRVLTRNNYYNPAWLDHL